MRFSASCFSLAKKASYFSSILSKTRRERLPAGIPKVYAYRGIKSAWFIAY
jgi:hypothetical protein